jgi:hypothetical protein
MRSDPIMYLVINTQTGESLEWFETREEALEFMMDQPSNTGALEIDEVKTCSAPMNLFLSHGSLTKN